MSGGREISTLFFTVRDDTPLQELEAEIFEDAIDQQGHAAPSRRGGREPSRSPGDRDPRRRQIG